MSTMTSKIMMQYLNFLADSMPCKGSMRCPNAASCPAFVADPYSYCAICTVKKIAEDKFANEIQDAAS